MQRITFTCWTCFKKQKLADVLAGSCCFVCLQSMSEMIQAVVVANLPPDEIVNLLHHHGDWLANRLIIDPDFRRREAAIAWRNYRGKVG